jgi:hypothetical protein
MRIANLGLTNFLVKRSCVVRGDGKRFDFEIQRIVGSGTIEEVVVPDGALKDVALDTDLDFSLEYLGLDESGQTPHKTYSVTLGINASPFRVSEGLGGSWWLVCPNCSTRALLNVEGLKTFQEADEKRARVVREIGETCPDHSGDCFFTPGDIKKHRQQATPPR